MDRCNSIRLRFSIDDRHIPSNGSTTKATGALVKNPKPTNIAAVAMEPTRECVAQLSVAHHERDEQHADDGARPHECGQQAWPPVAELECLQGHDDQQHVERADHQVASR